MFRAMFGSTGGQELGVESGEINFVLIAGDKLMTEDGLAEVSLGQNNYLRIDRYSLAEMVRLPESGYEEVSLHLYRGRFYLRVSYLAREKDSACILRMLPFTFWKRVFTALKLMKRDRLKLRSWKGGWKWPVRKSPLS